MTDTESAPVIRIRDLDADEEQEVIEIESLCMNCHEQGSTRMILTRIPFFKEVIISSFSCDECGFQDRQIQPGGRVQEKGVRYELTVQNKRDLNRQVVKSDSAMLAIPSLEFEHPPSKKGEISTVEGLIEGVKNGLEQDQPVRRALYPDTAKKIDQFIEKLTKLKELDQPFKMILDDPTGNSFLENPSAPKKDESLTITHYTRSREQDIQIGVLAEEELQNSEEAEGENGETEKSDGPKDDTEKPSEGAENLKDEVMSFYENCNHCNAPCETNMKMTKIPFFKEVLVMATYCESCGHKDNEIKSGSGIEEKGTRIELKLTDSTDLNRDVLKSETCGLEIPELEFEMQHGTLGGRFTTIEGLLRAIRDQLADKNPFFTGDSAAGDTKAKLKEFIEKMDRIISGDRLGVTLILDDPAGNSFLQNVYAPDPDPEMTVTHYNRNYEQNEILGLNDMKTENYENDS